MAMIRATTVVAVAGARLPRAQLRVARTEKFRCAYSKEGLKACSVMNLSPAVLKGLGLQRVSRPWGSELVEERMDTEDTRLRRLSRALNPGWILWCVVGVICVHPLRRR
ncbi:hypothetical protein ACQ4PT_032965 [Festuca glaucescens]